MTHVPYYPRFSMGTALRRLFPAEGRWFGSDLDPEVERHNQRLWKTFSLPIIVILNMLMFLRTYVLDQVSPVKSMAMGCWATVLDVSYGVWFMTNDIDVCRCLGYLVSFIFLGIGPLLDSLFRPGFG